MRELNYPRSLRCGGTGYWWSPMPFWRVNKCHHIKRQKWEKRWKLSKIPLFFWKMGIDLFYIGLDCLFVLLEDNSHDFYWFTSHNNSRVSKASWDKGLPWGWWEEQSLPRRIRQQDRQGVDAPLHHGGDHWGRSQNGCSQRCPENLWR